MSQEDLQMIETMLKGLLLADNTQRKEAEAKLQTLLQTKEPLCICLSQILTTSTDPSVLTYAAIIIRKIFIVRDNEISSAIWVPFKPESKNLIKTNLVNALVKTTDKSIRKKICDAIVNVFTCLSENEEKWEDLLRLVVEGFKLELNQNNLDNIMLSLNLLSAIYGIAYDDLKGGIATYTKCFQLYFKSDSLPLKAKTVKCISELLCSSLSKKESKQFRDFIFSVLETTLQCLNSGDNDNLRVCLESLNDLSNCEPKILRKSFADIFILMGKIIEKKEIDDSLREISFELLVALIEGTPKVIEKDNEKLTTLVQALFKYAMEIDSTIDEDWKRPSTEIYISDEFIPEEKLDEVCSLIKRLLEALETEELLQIISKNVMELLSHSGEDWKFKYIAYITIAEIVEYAEDLSKIKSIIETILADVKNPNVKVQYACLYCIAEISDSHNPDFQNEYHQRVMPLILEVFKTSNVLRIQFECCDALDCFVEHLTDQDAAKYLQDSLDILFGIFTKSEAECPSSLKQGILNVVTQFIDASSEEFKKYAEKCLKILLDCLDANLKENKDKNLLGLLLETISSIGPLCPELFKTYLINIVDTLTKIQMTLHSFKDNIANYIYSTWEKIIPSLVEGHKEKIPQVIESLITILNNPIEMSVQSTTNKVNIAEFFKDTDEKETKKEKVTINTSETEEFTTFIEILNLILENSPEAALKYIDSIYPLCNRLLKYPNEDIQSQIANTYPHLIGGLVKAGDANALHATAKKYISEIVMQLEKEKGFSLIVELLNSVREIIEKTKMFLVTPEINDLSQKILLVFNEVEKARISLLKQKEETEKELEEDKKKGNNKIYSDDEDDGSDEEVLDDIKDQIDELEEVQTSFSDFFGTLFDTHKQLTLEIVEKITKEYLPKYFDDKASNFEKKLGVLIVDDMAEFLGQALLSNIWTDIAKILVRFTNSMDFDLRNSAAYGIGVFSKFTTQNFELYANDLLTALTAAMTFPSNVKKSDKENMKFAKDNAISALGKIIQYHGKEIDLNKWIEVWINGLPITEDHEEGKLMNAFLIEILEKSPNLVLGADNKNLGHICKIFAKGYNTEFCTDETNKKIVEFVKGIKGNPAMMAIVENYTKSLKEGKKTKNKILELIKN